MTSLHDRFFEKVRVNPEIGCYEWTGCLNSAGYGQIRIDGVTQLSHRVAYEFVNAPIPPKMTIDHLCRNRACVNTEHLEVVTYYENSRRADVFQKSANARKALTHCKRGHSFSGANLGLDRDNHRYCKKCIADNVARWSADNRNHKMQLQRERRNAAKLEALL